MAINTRVNIGDLRKYKKGAVREHMEKLTREAKIEVAYELLRIIKRHLEDQDLPWPPLKPEYKEAKAKAGLDTRMWIATGELTEDGLGIWVSDDGNNVFVGFHPKLEHISGLTYSHLARIHEFGVPERGIPARPLLRPSAQELRNLLKRLGVSTFNSIYSPRLSKKYRVMREGGDT